MFGCSCLGGEKNANASFSCFPGHSKEMAAMATQTSEEGGVTRGVANGMLSACVGGAFFGCGGGIDGLL